MRLSRADYQAGVTAIDSFNDMVEGGAIHYPNVNGITVSFVGGFSGKAVCGLKLLQVAASECFPSRCRSNRHKRHAPTEHSLNIR